MSLEHLSAFGMHKRCSNAAPWTTLAVDNAHEGHILKNALDYFEQMQSESIFPNVMTYECIMEACAMFGIAGKGCYGETLCSELL